MTANTKDAEITKLDTLIQQIKEAMSDCETEEESVDNYIKYTSLLIERKKLKEES